MTVPVPSDATGAEIWFYSSNLMSCSSWDSRFGQNYWYGVAGPIKLVDNVHRRTGAVSALEMVNSVAELTTKVMHALGAPPATSGEELQTLLSVKAWVRNVAYEKNVWIDVHVFDGSSDRIHAEAFTLSRAE